MKIKNLLILGMVLLGFTYCSSDDVLDGPATGNETASNLKMEIAIKMPTGATTRTSTGSEGSKPGEIFESKANKVTIALYDVNNETFVASHTSELTDNTAKGDATSITTAVFQLPDLSEGKQYYVYAFVNPYTGLDVGVNLTDNKLNEVFSKGGTLKEAMELVAKKTSDSDGYFFMTNAEKTLSPIVNSSHLEGAPLKVSLNVQRAVARMDYTGTTTGEHELLIGSTGVKVKFTQFKPMNASKSFYNLKHISADGKVPTNLTESIVAGGNLENSTNYVVDTDWEDKIYNARTVGHWNDKFHSYMGTTTTTTKEDYAAFQEKYTALNAKFYTTENTLPADESMVSNNTKGIATAVVFKGHLVLPDNTSDYGDLTSKPAVYVWNNKYYGIFDKLPAEIKAIGENNKPGLAAAGVTGYSHDGTGYPVYYVYYNEHNQLAEKNKSTVGPMEFGVVRNNVYQLAINSLSKFGHPNDPELNPGDPGVDKDGEPIVINPDPSPEDPTHPIKSSELYMQVKATVLNWTVRENSIDF